MLVQDQQQACMESIESHGRNPSPSPPPLTTTTATVTHPFSPLSFFKVMIGDFSQALFLPPIVARKLGGLLNQNVDIEDSNGRRWGVKVSSVDNYLAFEQGWQDFVLDHSIKVGEFVVFNHASRSLFSSRIYAITGCERLEFNEKSLASKIKVKRKNEASADDLSLQKSQSVRELDKDVVNSSERSSKRKQATKSVPGDTSDSRMVTRRKKAGVKRKGEDVHALETSHGRSDSSKRPQIELAEPVVLQYQMVDKTDQVPPGGPVNEDGDVVTMTNGDNSNNGGDSVSKDISRDEQMSNVNFVEVPVNIASRDSVFIKGSITVSSINIIASEAKENSCDAMETEILVTKGKLSHGSSDESETDCIEIVDPLMKSGVLTGDNPQGIVAVSSADSIAAKAKGNSCGAIEDSPPKIVGVSSVNTITSEAIGNSYDVLQTADGLVMNEESECMGHGSQNDTEANCEIAMDPLISDKVITWDSLHTTSTAEGTKMKLEGGETDSFESFDHEVTEGNLNALDGVAYKFLGTLQGVCYIVEEDFADKFGDDIINHVDLFDADGADILHKTDGAFNEDESRHMSPTVPFNNVPQNEEELGSLGDVKVHISRTESVPCCRTPKSASHHTHDVNAVEQTASPSGKKPDEVLEENEKISSLSLEVTAHEDLKPECKDSMEFPSSDSFVFKFHLHAGSNPWLKLRECIPYHFGKVFLSRKVLVLQDPVMRMWPVLYCESKRFTGFIGGWKDFTAANDLKEGDMCELHLADKENLTFRVRITKAENPCS